MKQQNQKPETVTAAELARRADYSAPAISAWTRAGILTRTKGRYNLVESLEAIKRHEETRASDGDHDMEGLLDLRRELLKRRIEKIDHELAVAKGKVHDRTACCQSLLAIRSAESRILWNMAGRVSSAFPESGPKLVEFLGHEIDEILARLHDGTTYSGITFNCPHCHQPVEKLEAIEPTAPKAT